jgi:hypothetical protein
MSLTYAQIIDGLDSIAKELHTRALAGEKAADEFLEKKRLFEMTWAKEFLATKGDGALEDRKQATIQKIWKTDEYRDFLTAQAKYESWNKVTRLLGDEASILQSRLRAITNEGQTQTGPQPSWSRS